MGLRAEARELLQEGEDDQIREFITTSIPRQLIEAEGIYKLFDAYQYAFSSEIIDGIEELIVEISRLDQPSEDSSGQYDEYLSIVHEKGVSLLHHMEAVTDHELKAVANRLRGRCR